MFKSLEPQGDLRDKLIQKWKEGESYDNLRNWLNSSYSLNISARSVRRWLNKWGYKRAGPIHFSDKQDVTEKVKHDTQIEASNAELRYVKRLYAQLLKDQSGLNTVVDAIKELTQALPPVIVKPLSMISVKAASMQSAVAPLCDTHIGERVDLEQMAGLNEYNIDIFK